jgi:hypothetical protein
MTRSYDLAFVFEKAGLHPSQEPGLMKRYSGLSTESRVRFMDLAYKVFKEWPNREAIPKDKLPELQYASLLKLLRDEERKESDLHRKSGFNISDKKEGTFLKKEVFESLKTPRKESAKRRLIRVRAMPAIIEMRNTSPPTSWRHISEYIKRVYRKKISHSYIKRIFDEINS